MCTPATRFSDPEPALLRRHPFRCASVADLARVQAIPHTRPKSGDFGYEKFTDSECPGCLRTLVRRDRRADVLAVEAGDVADGDFGRAGGFAFVRVGAPAEAFFVVLGDH